MVLGGPRRSVEQPEPVLHTVCSHKRRVFKAGQQPGDFRRRAVQRAPLGSHSSLSHSTWSVLGACPWFLYIFYRPVLTSTWSVPGACPWFRYIIYTYISHTNIKYIFIYYISHTYHILPHTRHPCCNSRCWCSRGVPLEQYPLPPRSPCNALVTHGTGRAHSNGLPL